MAVKNTDRMLDLSRDLLASGVPKYGVGGRRNLIINGAMQVAQRGTTVSGGTGATSYGLDRFNFEGTDYPITTQVIHSNSQITDGNRNALKISTTGTAIGTAQISQRIERETFRHTIGQTVTFSCLVKRNSSNVTGGTLRMIASVNANTHVLRAAPDIYPSHTVTETFVSGVQNIPTDYTRYTASFTMPAGANTTDILEIGLSFINFTGAAATEDLFSISEMQLEVGDTATPFEHRSYAEELALCYRYYQRYSTTSGTSPLFTGVATNGTQLKVSITPYGGPMRIKPAVTLPGAAAGNQLAKGNGTSSNITAVSLANQGGMGPTYDFTSSGLTANHIYYVTGAVGSGAALELDAEL